MSDLLGLPIDASVHGYQIDEMIGYVHWLMFALFLGWGIYFIYALFRFRQSKNPKADYVGVKSHTSTYLEAGVALIEGVLLVGFAVPIWSSVVNAFPAQEDSIIVRVVAEQFAWNVHYPGRDGAFGKTDLSLVSAENPLGLDRGDPAAKDDITTINQLNLPVGKPVIAYLTSKDVIHSFSLPLFRVKHDAIPGERIPIWFVPEKTSEEVRNALTRTYSIRDGRYARELLNLYAVASYSGREGNTILETGTRITAEVIPQLLSAGIVEIVAAPDTPMEIACAQLCGLGHYRMRGFVNIQTPEEFDNWLVEEESYLEE